MMSLWIDPAVLTINLPPPPTTVFCHPMKNAAGGTYRVADMGGGNWVVPPAAFLVVAKFSNEDARKHDEYGEKSPYTFTN